MLYHCTYTHMNLQSDIVRQSDNLFFQLLLTVFLRSLATFSYMPDLYEQYASSAIGNKFWIQRILHYSCRYPLAAQAFLRGIFRYVHTALCPSPVLRNTLINICTSPVAYFRCSQT
jgi:hypothetical protein